MTLWRQSKPAALKPKSTCRVCPPEANCPESNHYTDGGWCVVRDHDCRQFKAKDWSKVDRPIRAKNRQAAFGSRFERLRLTDVEILMARGQSDVVDLRRQVPIPLNLKAGNHSHYVADGFAILRPGGFFTHRIYEVKGIRTPIYLMKRRIVQLQYPTYEFVEISA